MHRLLAHCALLVAFVCFVESSVDIPESLKNGKMNRYPACRALFSQNEESYAVVQEDLRGPFGKTCNCSFSRNPPQSGLSIRCQITREVVVPIVLGYYQHLTNVAYFIIRYRKKDSSDPWQEQRVEFYGNQPPVAKINFDFENGVQYIYIVQIYGVQSDGTRLMLHTDEISSATGASVISGNSPIYPTETTEYIRQTTLNFNMEFNEITDNIIRVFFQTDNRESFRVDYISNGRQLTLALDDEGRATLQGLQPETQYTFIVYYLQGGVWKELKRHSVRTIPKQRIVISPNRPVVTAQPPSRVTTLECPVVQDVEVEEISWYRVLEGGVTQLIATYTAESGETVYPAIRDPNFEVREGQILTINNAGPQYDGRYRCRISILGEDFQHLQQWQNVRVARLVRAYVTWRSAPGVTTYYLQYRPQTDVTGAWRSVVVDSQSNAIIENLQPLTTYIFKVFDYTGNTKGRLIETVTVKTATSGQEVLNFCQSEPCLNNGVCQDVRTGYRCSCQGGFSGINCERASTPCNPNPCENEGVCHASGRGYTCTCKTGYTGSQCRTTVPRNPCESNPCSHGTCSVLGVNYNCECERGYHGRNCDLSDSGPSFLLQCPINENYGTPREIRWYRVEGQRYSQIYTSDVSLQIGNVINPRYNGRLSSPSPADLIIHDAVASDVGTYQCQVSYRYRQETSPQMQLFQVPSDDTRIAFTWTPSNLYIDHYKVNYRNIHRDDEPAEVQIPPDSTRHTLRDLEPDGTYEIYVIPYTRSGDAAQPVTIEDISPDSPTITTTVSTTTTDPPSRGDSFERPIGSINVNVIPLRRGPYRNGSRVVLNCSFRRQRGDLLIIWKKDQRRITSSSDDRIMGEKGALLHITPFEESDAGTYSCLVEYNLPRAVLVGEGSIVVAAAKDIPKPTNLQIDITGPKTTVLTWQPPRHHAVTGYNVVYYPEGRSYSKQLRRVNIPRTTLTNLREGDEYVVQILAFSDQRFSEALEGRFTQQVERIPAPSNYRIVIVSDTQARISWDQEDESGITGYKVQYWDVTRSASPPNLVAKETTSRNVILNNLVNGKTYQISIQAKRGDKLSAPLSGQFRKTAPRKPNSPTSVSFRDVGSDEVTVFWDTPEGWTPDTKYRVRVQSRDSSNPLSITFPDSAPSSRTVTSLSPGVPYYVTVQSVLDGVLSNPIYGAVKTVDVVKLSAPYPDLVTLQCNTQSTSYVYQVQWYKVTPAGQENLIYVAYPPSSGTQSRHSSSDTQFIGRLSAPTAMELQVRNINYPEDFGKYKCKALSSGGRDSDVIDVVAKYPARIEPPFAFKHTMLNDTSARISWQHPYGEDISSYIVTYGPTVSYLGPEKSVEVDGTSVVLNDLIPGTDYTVTIKSKIVNRQSDDSLEGSFINFGNRVSNVQVTRLPDGNDLQITWDNPEGNEGIIFAVRGSDDDTWNEQPPVSGDTSSKRIRYPLEAGESVQIQISSVKNNVATPLTVKYIEPDSTPVNKGPERVPDFPNQLTPRPTVAILTPASVMNLRLESGSPDRLSISFDDTPVEDYDYYSINITNTRTGELESFNTTQPYLEVLLPNDEYEVSVSTVVDGISSQPITQTIALKPEIEPTPPALEPVSAPTNLRFSDIMRSRFTVLWDSDDDGSVTDFEVRYRAYDADEEWKTISTNHYQVTVRGVEADTVYIVNVVARNELGDSEPVEETVRTQQGRRVTLRRPRVRIITRTNNSFTLRFEDANTAYRIETALVGSEETAQITSVERGEDTVQLTGLGAGKHYRISVSRVANDRVGRPNRFRATTNPNQPMNIATSNAQPNSITLTWAQPDSDEITGYRVIYTPESTNIIQSVDTTTNSVILTNLEPNTRYNIQVQSKQGNEISAPTEFSISTTKDVEIQPVQEVRFSDVSENAVIFEWTPPKTRALYSYEVKLRPANDIGGWFPTNTTRENWVLIEGLKPATEYIAEVTSVLGDKRSEPVSTSVTTNVPITASVDVPISPSGGQPVEVTWLAIENAESYNVTYHPVHGSPQFVTVDGSRNSVVLEDLQPETEYVVHVTAFLNGVEGPPRKVTLTTGPVANPDNIEFEPSDGVMQMTWNDVNADRYEVRYHPVGDSRHSIVESVTTPQFSITNVEPGEYEITVTAIKSGHRSPSVTTVQPIGVKPPQEIEFTDETENGFVLMWEPSDTAEVVNYIVRVKPVDDVVGNFEELITEDTFMTLTDLEPGTTYTVQVIASTPDQYSEPITRTVSTGVASPELVTTTLGEDDESLVVNWQPVPNAFSYQVTYYPVGSSLSSITVVDGSENQTVLHDLQPDTQYIVEVTSLINDIESEPVINRVTTPLEKPKRVEEVTEENSDSSTSVKITWNGEDAAPTYQIRYFPVYETGEDVQYGEPQTITVLGSTGGTHLSDLLPATKYIVEVTAIDGIKTSRPQRVTVTTSLDQPEVVEDEPGEDELTLTWQPSDGTVTEYRVDLIPSDGSPTITVPVDGTRNSITVTNLQPGTEYEVRVTAVNADLRVESAPVITNIETKPADVKPVNANIQKLPDDSYVVTWTKPAWPVSYYTVHYQATDGTPSENTIQVLPDATSVTLPQLVPNTEYEIQIQGIVNDGDVSGEHNTVEMNVTTGVPSMSGPLTISTVTDEYVELVWDSPANNRYLSGYRVEFFPTGSQVLTNAVEVPRSANMASTHGLSPDTNYTARVTPHINFRPGRPASTTFVTDHPRPVPSPDSIETDERNPDNVVIRWEQPDNHDLITSYEILVEQDDGEIFSYEVDGPTNEFTVPDLLPGTIYNVTLISYVEDRPGQSVTTSFSTLPESPNQVAINNVHSDNLEVTWRPVDDAYSYIVSVRPLDNPSAETITHNTDQTRVFVTDLLPDTTYAVEVTALTPDGEESRPTLTQITTLSVIEDLVPEIPAEPEGSITITPQQEDDLISWEPILDVPVDVYQIFYTAPGEPTRTVTVPSFVNEAILSSLEPQKEYNVWVVGVLPFGENAPVTGISEHTVTIIPPDNYEPLTNEPITAPEDGKISVTWEPLGPDVTVYGVNYTNLGTGENYQTVVPGIFTGTLLSGLNPGDAYVIEVKGMENGVPVTVNNVNIGTSDFIVDENSIQSISPTGRFDLQWFQDSQDDDRIIGYTIIYERKCCLGEPDMIWVPAPNRSVILELEPNTEYVFRVEGKTTDGVQIPIPDVISESVPDSTVQPVGPTEDVDTSRSRRPVATRPGPSPATIPNTRSQPRGGTQRPMPTTASTTPASRTFEPTPTLPARTVSTTTRTRPVVVTRSKPFPDPLDNTERTQPSRTNTRPTTWPTEGQTTRVTSTPAIATTSPTQRQTPGVDALPTLDGNIVVSWTPVEEPDEYILEFHPKDDNSQSRTITIPGDVSWSSIPEPRDQAGYVMTIYTVKDGVTQPIYDVQLERSPTTGGFVLSYRPSSTDGSRTSGANPVTTQEILIPSGGDTGAQTELESEYTFNPSGGFEEEYAHWLTPITRPYGNSRTVMLRWNPDRTNITETIERLRLELVPINNTDARTIYRYVSSRGTGLISGLLPGVSYQLFAKYLRNGQYHRAGDIATQFVIPAFTSQGTRIEQRRFGSNDVWMKELRSGNLLLQWKNYPGATSYTIDDRELPDGLIHRSTHDVNNRWIVLPRLRPGGVYSINIYATVDGQLVKIYTVTVTRKVTGPSPPSKVEWYNMYGDSVDLAWIPPPTPITGYRITYKLDEPDTQEFVANLSADARTFHMSDLLPGKTYRITIQTLRGDQISRAFIFSLQMNIPTVRRLFFRQTGPDTIVVTWPALPDYVTGYLVQVKQVSPQGPDLIEADLLDPSQTEYTIKGIQPSYRYEFIIRTLVDDAESQPVTLQLWTLRQESQVSRIEERGRWTVTWSSEPYDVDHWKIEVRRRGDDTILRVRDNIDPSTTSMDFDGLPLGIEYVVSIYGVKDGVVSTPVQVVIPAGPPTDTQRGRPLIPAVGRQLVERLSVRRKSDSIQILIYPVGDIDRYQIQYKTPGMQRYISNNVAITHEGDHDVATISNLLPRQSYNFKITAIQGQEESTMVVDISTPPQQRRPLRAIQHVTKEDGRSDEEMLLRWGRPNVPIRYYEVTYNYTETGQSITRRVTQPYIYVPKISLGHSAIFRLGYLAQDGRPSPQSTVKISYAANQPAPPAGLSNFEQETEQP